MLGVESTALAVLIVIAVAAIPVAIIFFTLRVFRKKRSRGSEHVEDSGDKLKSVKQDRLEDSGQMTTDADEQHKNDPK